VKKRKSLALSLAVIVGISAPSALSERLTTTSVNLVSRATLSSNCFGYTHYPHKSRHFNSTVNVIAETICNGKFVSIKTTLSGQRWFIFRESATKSASAQNKVKINDFAELQVENWRSAYRICCRIGSRESIWSTSDN
jgi:hypothetical protein